MQYGTKVSAHKLGNFVEATLPLPGLFTNFIPIMKSWPENKNTFLDMYSFYTDYMP